MSTFQFRGKLQDAREVGGALNVKMLLEGSVRSAGDRLRVTAQLINVENGYHIWSERYDRQMEDVFAIQDEISSNIVDVLKLRLGSKKLKQTKRPTDNLEAYHLYLKGRHFWHHRQPEMQRRALKAYQQAMEKDPDYALAHAGIVWIRVIMGLYGLIPPATAYMEAKVACERARKLDDSHADVRISPWALAFFFENDWDFAERIIKEALELEPKHVEAHCFYGLQLSAMGRHEEAVRKVQQAQQFDPLSTYANSMAGWLLLEAGRNEQAISEFRKALDIDPDYLFPLPMMAGALIREDEHEEGVSILQRAVSVAGSSAFHLGWLGWALGVTGAREEAKAIHEDLAKRAESEFIPALYVGWVLSGLQEKDSAFEWLEKAFEEKDMYLRFWRLPVFDSLTADPRFHELLSKYRLGV
jgi:tetratricopeptide (TPR) repeat protein